MLTKETHFATDMDSYSKPQLLKIQKTIDHGYPAPMDTSTT